MDKILANKKILFGVVIGIIIILILAGVFYFVLKGKNQSGESKNENLATSTSGQDLAIALEELKNLKVPEPSDIVQEQFVTTTATLTSTVSEKSEVQLELAIPEEAVPVNPQSESNLRVFNLNIKNNKVLPKEIRVYSGDVVDINVKAIDKNYDFKIPSYGLGVQINKGETKKVQFQATNIGKFNFECSLCSPKFVGLIIVVPR